MKGSKMSVVFRLIMMCLFFFMFVSCIQAHLENKMNIKKARLQEVLNPCMGKLTKKDLAMKVSAPAERVPVNDGEEIWIYKYRGTRGDSRDGHPISMDVRINFDKNGIMTNGMVTGHVGEFDTPFEDLNCANLQPAMPSGNAPSPGNLTGGYLGVRVQSVTEDLAQASGLNKVKGAFVLIVSKNSPAEQSGIKSGDIILAIDGKAINDWSELTPTVQSTPVGKMVDVLIFRDGQERIVKVKIGNLQSAVPSGSAPAPALPAGAYQGSRSYGNGDKYVGDFVQGTFNGKGIYTYANGNKYEGAFVNGKFASEGTFTCSNGKKHQGSLEGKEPLGLNITCD